MIPKSPTRSTSRWIAGAAGLAAATYGASAAVTWLRYGHHAEPGPDERDMLLDTFIPRYEVVERHHIQIAAPADVVMAAAREMDMAQSPLVQAIFKAREVVMGAMPGGPRKPRGIIDETLSLGWGVLADVPGREIVVGAVTRPWEADVKFIAVPPDRFAAFAEPAFVKIVWTLRADPIGPASSVFRTETRVVATDAFARSKFRRYWSLASPGIWLIRRMSLGPLRREAEGCARRVIAA
jgi:hypothetical protein